MRMLTPTPSPWQRYGTGSSKVISTCNTHRSYLFNSLHDNIIHTRSSHVVTISPSGWFIPCDLALSPRLFSSEPLVSFSALLTVFVIAWEFPHWPPGLTICCLSPSLGRAEDSGLHG